MIEGCAGDRAQRPGPAADGAAGSDRDPVSPVNPRVEVEYEVEYEVWRRDDPEKRKPGTRAFEGASAVETMFMVVRDEPVSLAQAAPHVPALLRWVVERCLAKEPDERYASTRDLGYLPRTSIEEGIPNFVAWYRDYYGV